MSSRGLRLLLAVTSLSFPGVARAQDSGPDTGPVTAEAAAQRQRDELAEVLNRPEECDLDPAQPDTIVVCRELGSEETERVMSVLPSPVESDRHMLPGLNDPPCWVAPRGSVCMRGGFRPPQVVLIDLDAIPEALSAEEEALVFAVEPKSED